MNRWSKRSKHLFAYKVSLNIYNVDCCIDSVIYFVYKIDINFNGCFQVSVKPEHLESVQRCSWRRQVSAGSRQIFERKVIDYGRVDSEIFERKDIDYGDTWKEWYRLWTSRFGEFWRKSIGPRYFLRNACVVTRGVSTLIVVKYIQYICISLHFLLDFFNSSLSFDFCVVPLL